MFVYIPELPTKEDMVQYDLCPSRTINEQPKYHSGWKRKEVMINCVKLYYNNIITYNIIYFF